jgi:hypothetical protein
MERPISIVWFERCYLGSLIVSLVATAVQWPALVEKMSVQMAANPAAAQLGPSFIPASLGFGVVLVIATSLLLWFFTARKHSVVTKWIITVLFAYNVVMLLFGFTAHTMPAGLNGILSVVALVLDGVAVWQMFKPDARRWFGEIAA